MRLSRRQGLQLMLGAAQAVFLGAAGCATAGYAKIVTARSGGAPLAYWRCSNSEGLFDEQAWARHGTYTGSPSLVSGLPADSDQALSFPGDVHAEVADDAGLHLPEFSISGWLKVTANPSSKIAVWSKDASGLNDGDFALTIDEDLSLGAQFQSASSEFALTTSIDLDVAYHWAVVAGAFGFDLFLNGKHVGRNTSFTNGWANNVQAIQFAKAPWTSEELVGVLDEVALYDYLLTDADVVALSQVTSAPVAAADSAVATENQTAVIDAVGNDTYVGRKSDLAVELWNGSSWGSSATTTHGTATVRADNDIGFAADEVDDDEADSFQYRITDANGTSDPATVSLTVQDEADDGYSVAVTGISGLVAYWRLGDGSTSSLADASGNGHHGSYIGSPTLEAPGRSGRLRSWQASAGKAVDFGGQGHGTVAHDAAFALAQGTLGFYFKATQNAIDNKHTLVAKNTAGNNAGNFIVRLKNGDGTLAAVWADGTTTASLATQPGVIDAAVWHYVAVTWTPKIVRMWLDGREVAWSRDYSHPMDSNTDDWTFANDGQGGDDSDVMLDELALFSRVVTFDEHQILSEHAAGLGYTDADMSRTVNVSDSSELSSALTNAQAGDLIELANGSYSGDFDTSVAGTRENPIVIRGTNGPDNVTITGHFHLDHDWNILDGVTVDDGIVLNADYTRATRFKVENFEASHGILVEEGAFFARADHAVSGPPDHDTGGASDTNQPIRVMDETVPAYYPLIDHIEVVGPPNDLGNGRDGFSVGGGSNVDTYTCFHKLFLDGYDHDEAASIKSSSVKIQFSTFRNIGSYANVRHGSRTEWRSNYFLGSWVHWFGDYHWVIGNEFDNCHPIGLPAGDTTQPERVSPEYPASRFGELIGNVFSNGSDVDVGVPDWANTVDATGWTAEGSTNFSTNPADSDGHPRYTGTLTDSGATDEPFEPAVQITASDVGPDAGDPLVPSGWN